MAGLLEDAFSPEVLGLLGIRPNQSGGLLAGWSGPKAGEDWTTRLFGNSNDPNDPRGRAMMALSLGLMRGNVPDAFAGAQQAFTDNEDRMAKRQLAQAGLLKSGVELQGLLDTTKRNRGIRGDLLALEQNQQPTPAGSADFGGGQSVPSLGGMPMFSQPAIPQPSPLARIGQSGGTDVYAPQAGMGQPGMPSRASLADGLSNRLIQQAQVYARWGDFNGSNRLYEQAAKFMPEVKEIGTAIRDGKPVQVITYKDGRQQVSDFSPTPKVHWLDAGSSITPIDENSMSPLSRPIGKTMTPGDRIAAGNLSMRQREFDLNATSPQYMQTDNGLIALPKRPGPGPIVGTQVTGPGGESLSMPLKPIPPQINQAIVSNYQNLQKAQKALALLNGENVGTATGDPDATGWRGFLPAPMLDRMDPQGIDTRASISDLGSMVLHDRSGAAVTAAEWPRLRPFIPTATDTRESAQKKLQRFIEIYGQEADALSQIYAKDQGYRPNPILEQRSAGTGNRNEPAKGQAFDSMPAANAGNKGKFLTDTATGKRYRSTGAQWVEVN